MELRRLAPVARGADRRAVVTGLLVAVLIGCGIGALICLALEWWMRSADR